MESIFEKIDSLGPSAKTVANKKILECIKELAEQFETFQAEINDLKKENLALKAKQASLEKKNSTQEEQLSNDNKLQVEAKETL